MSSCITFSVYRVLNDAIMYHLQYLQGVPSCITFNVSKVSSMTPSLCITSDKRLWLWIDNFDISFISAIKAETSFVDLSVLSTPNKTQEKPAEHLCATCGKSYQSKTGLRRHERAHSDDFPHRCDQCGKGFFTLTHYTDHVVSHAKGKGHVCATCKRSFHNACNLKKHIKSQHQSNKESFTCAQCNKTFTGKRGLQEHLTTVHDLEKRYKCSTCMKYFRYRSTLLYHRMVKCGKQ